jgi:hypothetical protein
MVIHMVFCTECGEELPPDAKFCESCGAPVEEEQALPGSPAPVQAHPVQETPADQSKKPPSAPVIIGIIAVLIVIAVLMAGVWFVGLPYLQKTSTLSKTTPVPTTVPVIVTSMPTLEETTLPMVTPSPTSTRKLEGRYEEYYDEVYSHEQFYAFGQKETFSYNLETPPLYIKYNLTPRQITRKKIVDIGMSTERTIDLTYPNPNAWFEITVLNADSGSVVTKQGYGKDYPDVTRDEFMVRNKGNYRIEFSGNDVTADIHILQGTP